jgi:hypothetical protein
MPPTFRILFAISEKFGIAGQQLYPIEAPCLGQAEISLADPK